MMHAYRKYLVRENWDKQITPAMLNTNILAYGRKEEDRKRLVTRKALRHALLAGEHIVLYAEDPIREFEAALNEAPEEMNLSQVMKAHGYRIIDLSLGEVSSTMKPTDWQDMLTKEMSAQPTMIRVKGKINKLLTTSTEEGLLLVELYVTIKIVCDFMASRATCAHVILDDNNANLALSSKWLQNKQVKFCIATTSRIAQSGFRRAAVSRVVETRENGTNMIQRFLKEVGFDTTLNLSIEEANRYVMEFMLDIHTVLCLGADDINPAEHREFLHQCVYGDKIKLGGKYVISEKTTFAERNQFCKMSKRQQVRKSATEDIEVDDYYDSVSDSQWFDPGNWVIEVDNRIRTYFVRGRYFPVIFPYRTQAKNWLIDEFEMLGMENYTLADEDDKISVYEVTDGVGNVVNTITITCIEEKDCDMYRDKYLLNVLEIGEAETVMEQNAELIGIEGYAPGIAREILADYVSRNGLDDLAFPKDEEVAAEELPEADSAGEEDAPFEIPEEYRWKPYVAPTEAAGADNGEEVHAGTPERAELPETGVLFLGGHQNMTKKLRQLFPKWSFMSDDLFYKGAGKYDTVFFWSKHCSHPMMWFVQARDTKKVEFLYVTATNIERLVREMEEKYAEKLKKNNASE